jgi:hypothetical protein
MEESDSKQVIGKWVEDTLQMEVTYTSKLKMAGPNHVEDTLQMEVTYTTSTPVLKKVKVKSQRLGGFKISKRFFIIFIINEILHYRIKIK